MCNNPVHAACLDEWRHAGLEVLTRCSICRSDYNLQYTYPRLGLYMTDNQVHLVLGFILLNMAILNLTGMMWWMYPNDFLPLYVGGYYMLLWILTAMYFCLLEYVRLRSRIVYNLLLLVQTAMSTQYWPLLHYHISVLVIYNCIFHPTFDLHSMVLERVT